MTYKCVNVGCEDQLLCCTCFRDNSSYETVKCTLFLMIQLNLLIPTYWQHFFLVDNNVLPTMLPSNTAPIIKTCAVEALDVFLWAAYGPPEDGCKLRPCGQTGKTTWPFQPITCLDSLHRYTSAEIIYGIEQFINLFIWSAQLLCHLEGDGTQTYCVVLWKKNTVCRLQFINGNKANWDLLFLWLLLVFPWPPI